LLVLDDADCVGLILASANLMDPAKIPRRGCLQRLIVVGRCGLCGPTNGECARVASFTSDADSYAV